MYSTGSADNSNQHQMNSTFLVIAKTFGLGLAKSLERFRGKVTYQCVGNDENYIKTAKLLALTKAYNKKK